VPSPIDQNVKTPLAKSALNSRTPSAIAVLIVLVCVLIALVLVNLFVRLAPAVPVQTGSAALFHGCKGDLSSAGGQGSYKVEALVAVSTYCVEYATTLSQMGDWEVRRSKFLLQEYEEKAMLAVVLITTLSGVGLAAYQLLVAPLGATGRRSEPFDSHIKAGLTEISIKSSVVGLGILAISLAFFGVYVVKIYPLTIASVAPTEERDSKPVPQPQLFSATKNLIDGRDSKSAR
jgi:hypothetical protein